MGVHVQASTYTKSSTTNEQMPSFFRLLCLGKRALEPQRFNLFNGSTGSFWSDSWGISSFRHVQDGSHVGRRPPGHRVFARVWHGGAWVGRCDHPGTIGIMMVIPSSLEARALPQRCESSALTGVLDRVIEQRTPVCGTALQSMTRVKMVSSISCYWSCSYKNTTQVGQRPGLDLGQTGPVRPSKACATPGMWTAMPLLASSLGHMTCPSFLEELVP